MLSKTFKGGLTVSGAKATINYLLNERVGQKTAKILEGNVDLTMRIIAETSKKQKWSWSSGVLTFEENITDQQKKDVIEDFKKVTFPGMNPDQYNILMVEHTDKGRTEIHYVIPRIELTTGKAFNPYYVKRDFKKKDLFQDVTNLKYGFSQWQNAETLTHRAPVWQKEKNIKSAIDKNITSRVKSGEIENRAELILQMSDWGFETSRVGKTYTTFVNTETNKKYKMKGDFYGEGFDNGIAGIRKSVEERKKHTSYGVERDFVSLARELNDIVKFQAQQNRETYRSRERELSEKTPRTKGQTREDNRRDRKTDVEKASPHTSKEKGLENDRIRANAIGRIRKARKRTRRRAGRASYRAGISADRVENYISSKCSNPTSIAKGQRQRRLTRNTQKSFGSLVRSIQKRFSRDFKEIINHKIKMRERTKTKEILSKMEKFQKPRSLEQIKKLQKEEIQKKKEKTKIKSVLEQDIPVKQSSRGFGLDR